MNKKRGYHIIEPPIHEQLNWDMDMIVKCLELIRQKLPTKFPEFPSSIEYELIPLGNPFGDAYPVIGAYSDIPEDLNQMPQFHTLYDIVEIWIQEIGIENLKEESKSVQSISWQDLQEHFESK